MDIRFDLISEYIMFIIQGALYTIFIGLVSALFGVLIGTILALFKVSKNRLLEFASSIYTDIFRGTPVLLQLAFIYYALPQIADITLDPVPAAIITFSLNSGAYLSEVMRAGVQNVDKGQIEAAKSLGVKPINIFFDIIFPQAVRNVLPALVNEFATLIKESSVVSIIGVMDIMRRQQIVSGTTYRFFEPLIIAGIVYYVIVKIVSIMGKYLEGRLNYDNNKKSSQAV